MNGWGKVLGAVGIAGAVILIVSMFVSGDLSFGDDTLRSYLDEKTFQYAGAVFGVLVLAMGIGIAVLGAKSRAYVDVVLGAVAAVAGLIAVIILGDGFLDLGIIDKYDDKKIIFGATFFALALSSVLAGYFKARWACVFGLIGIAVTLSPLLEGNIFEGMMYPLAAALAAAPLFLPGKPAEEKEKAVKGRKGKKRKEQADEPRKAAAPVRKSSKGATTDAVRKQQNVKQEKLEMRKEEAKPKPAPENKGASAVPALPKMMSSRDANRAAAEAKEAPKPEPVIEPMPEPVFAPAAPEVPAREREGYEPAPAAPAQGRHEPTIEPMPEPVAEPAFATTDDVPSTVEAPKPEPVIEPMPEPVFAPEVPAREREGYEPEAVLTLEELGIEPDTPETIVRRACWNRGLRCRRDYGDDHIPFAFVKGQVAVFVDASEPDISIDAKLESEGWAVFHFRESDIGDGESQADIVEAAVKENLKAHKSAKKKGKKR